MNIVVVTWAGGKNYGTYLQAYALCTKLRKIGHKVSLLTGISINRSLIGYIRGIVRPLWMRITCKDETLLKMLSFKRKYMNEKKIVFPFQITKLVNSTDVFVTGSDQIWNTYHEYNPTMFLDFVKDKKRIAYASSIGTNDVKEDYKEGVKQHLLKFKHIGVREEVAAKALSKLTGRKDIMQVLDPTFLLTPMDWFDMSRNTEIKIKIPQKYILCYFVGENSWYSDQLAVVKEKTNIENIVIVPLKENSIFTHGNAIIYKHADPAEFIHLLRNASLICTDSFHASALSINNSKNFVEFMRFKDDDQKSQNSRIYDLLDHYNLTDRIYNVDNMSWADDIDYNEVQNTLETDRKRSLDYLVNAIEN